MITETMMEEIKKCYYAGLMGGQFSIDFIEDLEGWEGDFTYAQMSAVERIYNRYQVSWLIKKL